MKQFFIALAMLTFGSSVYAQNGMNEVLVSPNNSSPYFLVDTVFTLGTGVDDTTTIYLHYHNSTAQTIQGLQVRFFYDNVNFLTPIVKWGPTMTSVSSKYGSFYSSSNWVNATAVYTGTLNTFNLPNGAIFKIVLPHKPTYDPATVGPITLNGTPVYTNLATTNGGVDVSLGMFSYGGTFIQPSFNYNLRVWNVGSQIGAEGVSATYSFKKKNASSYTASNLTFTTDSTGLATITIPYDTNYYNVKLITSSSSMSDGGAINVTDAYKILSHTILADTLETYGFQQGDVNLSNSVTVSDGFLVFNRIANLLNVWSSLVAGENNVKLLTPSEYTTILNNPTSHQTSIDGTYSVEQVINSLDSTEYRAFVLGDATNTGVNNQMVLIAAKVNPGQPSDWVLDQGVLYRTIEDSVEFRVPRITPTQSLEFDVPVTIYTHGNKIGAAQIGLEFNSDIFEFLGVQTSDVVGQWNSFVKVDSNRVIWGGHENQMAPALIETNQDVITFKFRALTQDWDKENIRVFNKGAGSEKAEDLNIKPTPTDGTILYVGKTQTDPLMEETIKSFLVYPNPVTDGYLLIDFYTWEDTPFTAQLFAIDGRLMKYETKEVQEGEIYTTYIDLSFLDKGTYILKLNTNSKEKFVKVLKF